MKTQFLKVSALRKFINSRGRKLSNEFVAAIDTDVRNKVAAACAVHNGGRKVLDASIAGHVGILRAALLMLFLGLALSAPAMSHFEALSQIETGNDDHAIGAAGEVSRFQILPSEWQAATNYLDHFMKGIFWNPTDPYDAECVAYYILLKRDNTFISSHHRAPSDFEMYLLWSCPSRVNHPSKFKAEAARRFSNLCADVLTVRSGLD